MKTKRLLYDETHRDNSQVMRFTFRFPNYGQKGGDAQLCSAMLWHIARCCKHRPDEIGFVDIRVLILPHVPKLSQTPVSLLGSI